MSSDEFSVLVVCTGNVNRSALGAALLETWSGWYLPESVAGRIRVTSAGLRAPVGSRMGRRARLIAEALGADGSAHRAEQITERAIRAADLVLVSSVDQRESILGLVPGALQSTFTIREAGRLAEVVPALPAPVSVDDIRERLAVLSRKRAAGGKGDDDIIDPEGKDDEAYRLMARQEVPPLAQIAAALLGMPPAEVAAYREAAEAGAFLLDGGPTGPAATSTTRNRGRREA